MNFNSFALLVYQLVYQSLTTRYVNERNEADSGTDKRLQRKIVKHLSCILKFNIGFVHTLKLK